MRFRFGYRKLGPVPSYPIQAYKGTSKDNALHKIKQDVLDPNISLLVICYNSTVGQFLLLIMSQILKICDLETSFKGLNRRN